MSEGPWHVVGPTHGGTFMVAKDRSAEGRYRLWVGCGEWTEEEADAVAEALNDVTARARPITGS